MQQPQASGMKLAKKEYAKGHSKQTLRKVSDAKAAKKMEGHHARREERNQGTGNTGSSKPPLTSWFFSGLCWLLVVAWSQWLLAHIISYNTSCQLGAPSSQLGWPLIAYREPK
jgi:hypothetical protein